MSAIAGVYAFDGRHIEPTEITGMLAAQSHRGPNGSGKWVSGSIALGNNILWSSQESLDEKAPLVDNERGIVLTADARIDNRDDLYKTLQIENHQKEIVPDSEIILRAYHHWGEQCPDKLLGDFSFAIWDQNEQKLFCARDHFGIKPFYYYRSATIFAFASEIKALSELSYVPHKINDIYIAGYLTQTYIDNSLTSFQDIFRLPPAHCLTIKQDGIQTHKYWRLDPTLDIFHKTEDEYASEFHQIFQKAVSCRLRSVNTLGFSLSGGLDSSSIVCMADQLSPIERDYKYQTFSAIFPHLPQDIHSRVDEQLYIEAVLSRCNIDPHFIRADNLNPFINAESLIQYTDEPYFAPNLFMYWELYQTAREQGIRVFLDGIDGDVTVSHGLEYLPDLVRNCRWGALYHEAQEYTQRFGGINPFKLIWKYGLRPLIPTSLLGLIRASTGKDFLSRSIINPNLAKRIDLSERFHQTNGKSNFHLSARERHQQELESPQLTLDLELLDKVSAAFSIETRHPFFDKRLVEYCLALPPEQKLSQGWTRYVFRRATASVLPEQVCWRTSKADFSVNFLQAIMNYDKALLKRLLFSNTQIIEPYFDIPKLESTYQRVTSQPDLGIQDALIVYGAATLIPWLKKYSPI
ncbi:MAG: lasso peptide isopeptide bond-forming cyclase [Anaerolineales bacterium]|nr:lasso peptide isopeptide bond-forming cyclase [Anaerolineales bacterium]